MPDYIRKEVAALTPQQRQAFYQLVGWSNNGAGPGQSVVTDGVYANILEQVKRLVD